MILLLLIWRLLCLNINSFSSSHCLKWLLWHSVDVVSGTVVTSGGAETGLPVQLNAAALLANKPQRTNRSFGGEKTTGRKRTTKANKTRLRWDKPKHNSPASSDSVHNFHPTERSSLFFMSKQPLQEHFTEFP